ncbi:MAG: hypothetical protein M5U35_06050 [Roseovarius sp.]|nr:hypothetical protein [Roseovarius sp.]
MQVRRRGRIFVRRHQAGIDGEAEFVLLAQIELDQIAGNEPAAFPAPPVTLEERQILMIFAPDHCLVPLAVAPEHHTVHGFPQVFEYTRSLKQVAEM